MDENEKLRLGKIKILAYLVGPLTEDDIKSSSNRAKKILAATKAYEQMSREVDKLQ